MPENFEKVKRRRKTGDSTYTLQSQWTSSETVELHKKSGNDIIDTNVSLTEAIGGVTGYTSEGGSSDDIAKTTLATEYYVNNSGGVKKVKNMTEYIALSDKQRAGAVYVEEEPDQISSGDVIPVNAGGTKMISTAISEINNNFNNYALKDYSVKNFTYANGWTDLSYRIRKERNCVNVSIMARYNSQISAGSEVVLGRISDISSGIGTSGACAFENNNAVGVFFMDNGGQIYVRPITSSADRVNLTFSFYLS